MITIKAEQVGILELKRPVKLLDLRGSGAMRAGSVAALAKVADRDLSQQWARHFYDSDATIEGIAYYNAHNDEEAIALFERAQNALRENSVIPLNHPALEPHILQAVRDNDLVVD